MVTVYHIIHVCGFGGALGSGVKCAMFGNKLRLLGIICTGDTSGLYIAITILIPY